MDTIQIQILYCHYGWSPAKIKEALNLPVTYIERVIAENAWIQGGKHAAPAPPAPPAALDSLVSDLPATTCDGLIQDLKDLEVQKQVVLAPLVAITEITLLNKIKEAIDLIEPDRLDAHTILSNLVKAFKQLTQDAVTTKVVNDAQDKPGIAIQVITQIT